MQTIGIRLKIRWEGCYGTVRTDESFDQLSSFDKLDLLKDWMRQLKALYVQSHKRVYPGLMQRKDDHIENIWTAIEAMVQHQESTPEDIEGFMNLAKQVVEKYREEC